MDNNNRINAIKEAMKLLASSLEMEEKEEVMGDINEEDNGKDINSLDNIGMKEDNKEEMEEDNKEEMEEDINPLDDDERKSIKEMISGGNYKPLPKKGLSVIEIGIGMGNKGKKRR